MKNLTDILYKAEILEVEGSLDLSIPAVAFDSRKVTKGCLFIAIPGTQVDGHQFITKAIEKGAKAIVYSVKPGKLDSAVSYIKVKDSSIALAQIASNFYDNPSEKLKLVGITGTNGKTTTATLLYNLFTKLGYKAGLLSTIQSKIHTLTIEATHTTPDALTLNELLNQMVLEGCDYAFMEVSSHAVAQNRIAGLRFAGGVFTNITHDHLDYHLTFKNYLNTKKKFFDELPSSAFALSNADDKNGMVMLQNTKAVKKTYGLKKMTDFKGKVIENHFDGLQMTMNGYEVHALLSGDFNAYNLMAVYGSAILLGMKSEEVLTAISTLHGAEGRFDLVRSKNGITGIIDYAHTPDALENVLKTINALRTQNEQLITVVGAGGDRDKTKRPKMARIASLLSNKVILTSDNPRTEDPEQILADMKAGIDPAKTNKTLVISNRSEAIKTAVILANKGDLILVAGKGHEKYQEIKGVKYPFDDKQLLTELFELI
jgi:UDP-N-acetylmuramoyl-L-alanyl-D-glutamate--2,6-diaminopimelate ligase